MQTPHNFSETKGVWLAILSGLLYGLLGYFGVSLVRDGVSVYNMSCWRFFIAFLLVFAWAYTRNHKPKLTKKTTISTVLNGAFFYSGAGIFFFLASDYIGTGQAMVIFFIYPIWVMILNWLFLGQAFRAHYFFAFVLIVAGLIFLVDVKDFSFDFLGTALSILASFCYAIYLFWSKPLDLDPLDSTILVSLGCALLGFVLALFDGSFSIPATAYQWLHLLGLSIVCTAIPIFLVLLAMKHLSSDKVSLLSVLEPVFTVIFGVILLHEVLTVNAIIGMMLTLFGATIVIVRFPDISSIKDWVKNV